MRPLVPALAVLLLLLMLTSAHAGVYQLPLPDLVGHYEVGGGARSQTFEFGQLYSRINDISIHWSGIATAGHFSSYEDGVLLGDFVYPALLCAWMDAPQDWRAWHARGDVGANTYPSTQAFDAMSQNDPSWSPNSLLDGTRTLFVEMDARAFLTARNTIVHDYPTLDIYAATLIIDAEPVPEPSGFVALSGLVVPCAGMLYRRRQHLG